MALSFDYEAIAAGASEEIKRQTIVLEAYIRRIAELEAALLPFAKLQVLYVDDVGRVTIRVNAADIERAAAAVMKLTP